MRIIFTLCALFCTLQILNAQEKDQTRLREISRFFEEPNVGVEPAQKTNALWLPPICIQNIWDDSSSVWRPNSRSHFLYNWQGQVVHDTVKLWDGSSYQNYELYKYAYDSFGNQILWESYNWDGTSYKMYSYREQSYSPYNHLVSSFYFEEVGGVFDTISGLQYRLTYDINGKSLRQIFKSYNISTGFRNIDKSYATYNASGLVEKLNVEIYAGGWVPFVEISYSYDSNGQLLEKLTGGWDGTNIFPDFRETYLINFPDSIVKRKVEKWGSGGYSPQSYDSTNWGAFGSTDLYIYNYTPSNGWQPNRWESNRNDFKLNLINSQRRDWISGVWETYYQNNYLYQYDINGNPSEIIYKSLNNAGAPLKNQLQTLYPGYFVGVETPTPQPQIEVFPNPTSQILHIRTPYKSSGEISLFDVQGRRALQMKLPPSGEANLNLEEQPMGVYFLRITQNGETFTKKVLKQ